MQGSANRYVNAEVSAADSTIIYSFWKRFKQALIDRDAAAIKAMSVRRISLSLVEPGQSLPTRLPTGYRDEAIERLLNIVSEPGFF